MISFRNWHCDAFHFFDLYSYDVKEPPMSYRQELSLRQLSARCILMHGVDMPDDKLPQELRKYVHELKEQMTTIYIAYWQSAVKKSIYGAAVIGVYRSAQQAKDECEKAALHLFQKGLKDGREGERLTKEQAREELQKREWSSYGHGTYFLQYARESLRFFVQSFKDPNRTGQEVEKQHMCYTTPSKTGTWKQK